MSLASQHPGNLTRMRVLPIRQQTMLANAFRAHLAEFGIVVVQGIRHVCELYGSSAARRAANGTQITDQVDRKGTPCLASDKPGKPAVGNDPRSGVYYGDNGTA
jgi:hypothetical protein